jgi:hypothetical protein
MKGGEALGRENIVDTVAITLVVDWRLVLAVVILVLMLLLSK